jgi:hypothetical protein
MTEANHGDASSIDALLNRLLELPKGVRLTRDEAGAIVVWLARRLEERLPGDAVVDESTLSTDQGGLSVTLCSQGTFGGALGLAWLAHLFITSLGDGEVSVNASVFLFSHNRRLLAPPRGDYLYTELQPGEGAAAQWSPLEWTRDVYDEWRDLETLED